MTARNTPVAYRLNGRKIKSTNDFYTEIGRAVNGRGGYFGNNLDALADCLRGGFGTPEDRPFTFVWAHSSASRRSLAEAGRPQFVDTVRQVFDDAEVGLELR